jgi:ABC-type glycerol-3-phosphate transport system permease component
MISGSRIVWFFHLPNLYDSPWALVFSYMIFTLPFTIWVLTSFMRALPADLEEAAYVDGATPLQVFWKVLLPLIAPGLVTTSSPPRNGGVSHPPRARPYVAREP